MPADQTADLFWNGEALAPPQSAASIVDDAGETSNPTKQVIDEPPNVRITGQSCPDRGTIGRSSTNRDYRMSTPSRRWWACLNAGFGLL
jgi:hypothetical protein